MVCLQSSSVEWSVVAYLWTFNENVDNVRTEAYGWLHIDCSILSYQTVC